MKVSAVKLAHSPPFTTAHFIVECTACVKYGVEWPGIFYHVNTSMPAWVERGMKGFSTVKKRFCTCILCAEE